MRSRSYGPPAPSAMRSSTSSCDGVATVVTLPDFADIPSDASSIMVSMNRLSTERRAQIIGCLVEGNSIRATVRMTGAAKNTVTKLLVDLGEACAGYQDRVLRDLPCTTLEVDEIWAYCYSKQRNVPDEHKGEFGYGDVW